MTAEEFVRLMREHEVTVDCVADGEWEARVMFGNDDLGYDVEVGPAGDPIDAMEKLAEKRDWVYDSRSK